MVSGEQIGGFQSLSSQLVDFAFVEPFAQLQGSISLMHVPRDKICLSILVKDLPQSGGGMQISSVYLATSLLVSELCAGPFSVLKLLQSSNLQNLCRVAAHCSQAFRTEDPFYPQI